MSSTVEFLADAFKAAGTPFIVGHPGGESVELMDAARKRDMRFILVKQEVAGAMLAATWGDITGAPGVCLSTRGPGAANMMNGIAYAALDRSPMIALTDRYSAPEQAVGLRQRIDHIAMLAPLVKWGTTIDARVVRQQVARAMRTATAPAPGPVHFDIPQSETTKPAAEFLAPPPVLPVHTMAAPDPAALRPLTDRIGAALRPILLAGLGVYWDNACDGLVALAERLGAPVLTTSKLKGAIPEDHPLRAGCIIGGLIERKLVEQADLIVTIGLDGVELQPKPWPYIQPVVAIANTPVLDALVPAGTEVIGDIAAILRVLAEHCPEGSGWGEKAAATFRTDVINALNTPSTGLSPQRAMEVARAVLPRDTIATCDAGASRLLVVQKWQSYAPKTFLTSNGLGSMGYAVPGALAARLAHPDRPVVAFTGDGGFMMAVADIQTAVKENLPITVVVLDDQEISMIRIKQELKGFDRYGVGVGGIAWESLAHGLGADGIVVDTENALQDALAQVRHTERTTIIAARIDSSGYVAQFNALREL